MKKTIIAAIWLALSLIHNANAALDAYNISETYNFDGIRSTFSGQFTFNTSTDLITGITGTLDDGVTGRSLSFNPATFGTSYFPSASASDISIDTFPYLPNGGIHEDEDIYDLSIDSANPTVVYGGIASDVYEYDLVAGFDVGQLTLTGYSVTPVPVPEPSAWSMVAIGGVALLGIMHRKKQRAA